MAARRWWILWSVLLALPAGLVFVLNRAPSLDLHWHQNPFHFYTVSSTTLLAAVTCGVLAASARSLRETRLLFLALAFLSIAAIFAVHGLTTPGYIHDEAYPALFVSSWLSVLAGALFITASAVDLPDAVDRAVQRHGKLIFGATVSALAVYVYASLFIRESLWLEWVPIQNRSFQLLIASVSMGLLAFSGWRYLQAYFFARLPSQGAMVIALCLLIDVQVSMAWGRTYQLSFWIYHAMYALAFVTLFAGWGMEVLRAGNVKVIAEGLSMRDALAQLNRGRPSTLVELADAIEVKDAATLGHVSRVASYALGIGRELGLPAWELRSLVLAAQMHDVGKIGTPDAILMKPGELTDEEYAVIKQHALRGHEIAGRVDALRSIQEVIRHHHERVDGAGYPDGLHGDEIPQLSRIIAVADTFDALTSARPYRGAMTREDALAELRRVSGGQLDPRCVEAFVASLAKPHHGLEQIEKAA
jgi:HD-GYP domain-containing protein (c-di-GMP phosphodiesterase class II)